MVASDSFAEFLREQLAPVGRVTMRRMFGKTGVFCDGLMFGMATENMLYLRVDEMQLFAAMAAHRNQVRLLQDRKMLCYRLAAHVHALT